MMKKYLSLGLILVLMIQLWGCAGEAAQETRNTNPKTYGAPRSGTVDLMAHVTTTTPAELMTLDRIPKYAAADFAVSLLQNSYVGQQDNLILSPYSVMLALAMTANGAQGETLTQMENVFGLSVQELNTLLYLSRICARDEIAAANSIWFRNQEGFHVREEFLQINGDYHDAELYAATFDGHTVEDINAWVKEHTKERIPEMLERLNPNDMMVLLNALSFDGVWAEPYGEDALFDGGFLTENGDLQSVTMMRSTEQTFLDDGLATGFVKDYENGYSFAALLPKEGVSIESYLASLSGETVMKTLENAALEAVTVTMPKLKAETTLCLNEALVDMGMGLAFDAHADFSCISDTELYISNVMHKTYLNVDEAGTQAGAASSVTMPRKGMSIGKSVCLDRPYVMLILDRQTDNILFLGVIKNPA